jgi:hypothetical protein
MRFVAIAVAALTLGCSSSRPTPGNYDVSPDAGAAVEDAGNDSGGNGLIGGGRCPMPSTVHVAISGFTTCTCLNGTFALVYDNAENQANLWKSAALEGCAAQTFVRFIDDPSSPQLAITNTDGQGDSADATNATCSPLAITGGGSMTGDIDFVCPQPEDANMTWTIRP